MQTLGLELGVWGFGALELLFTGRNAFLLDVCQGFVESYSSFAEL